MHSMFILFSPTFGYISYIECLEKGSKLEAVRLWLFWGDRWRSLEYNNLTIPGLILMSLRLEPRKPGWLKKNTKERILIVVFECISCMPLKVWRKQSVFVLPCQGHRHPLGVHFKFQRDNNGPMDLMWPPSLKFQTGHGLSMLMWLKHNLWDHFWRSHFWYKSEAFTRVKWTKQGLT